MLLWSYNKLLNDNIRPLIYGQLPTSPYKGYSHTSLHHMYNNDHMYSLKRVKFYCESYFQNIKFNHIVDNINILNFIFENHKNIFLNSSSHDDVSLSHGTYQVDYQSSTNFYFTVTSSNSNIWSIRSDGNQFYCLYNTKDKNEHEHTRNHSLLKETVWQSPYISSHQVWVDIQSIRPSIRTNISSATEPIKYRSLSTDTALDVVLPPYQSMYFFNSCNSQNKITVIFLL